MNRRGMALLLVLWLIVLLTGVAGISMSRSREGSLHARNRLASVRAGWAREACLEVMLGRAQRDSLALGDPLTLRLDSVDLGNGVWCSSQLTDPGESVNLNLASASVLRALLADSGLVENAMRGRPWASVDALPADFDRWRAALTVRGSGRINLLRAPTEVIATVTGLEEAGAREVAAARAGIRPVASLEELLNRLSRRTRDRIMVAYDRFSNESDIRTQMIVATIEGHVPERPVIARMTITLVPAGNRLAVVRREVE